MAKQNKLPSSKLALNKDHYFVESVPCLGRTDVSSSLPRKSHTASQQKDIVPRGEKEYIQVETELVKKFDYVFSKGGGGSIFVLLLSTMQHLVQRVSNHPDLFF